MAQQSTTLMNPPVPVVALVGWIIPGWGYWLLGQRTRALAVGLTIAIIFGLGIFIGGIRVVDPPNLASDQGTIINRVLQKPWFLGQVLTGPIGLTTAWISLHVDPSHTPHARVAEIATLYTAVAGMLNLIAIIDAAHRASHEERT